MTKKSDHKRIGFNDIEGDLATPEEFAMLTGKHENTIRNMCRDGRLMSTKIGDSWLIPFRKIFDVEKGEKIA